MTTEQNQGQQPVKSQQDENARTQSEQANSANPAGKLSKDKKAATDKKAGRPAPAPKAPAQAKAKKGEEQKWDGQAGYAGTGR